MIKKADYKLLALDPHERYLCVHGPIDTELLQRAEVCGVSVGKKILDSDSFTYVKRANTTIGDISTPLSGGFHLLQKALGGPNSLTTTLVGAGLGGLGGYSLGYAADELIPRGLRAILPNKYKNTIGRTKWAPILAALGAGVGALPGIHNSITAINNGRSILSNYPWDTNLDYSTLKKTSADNATGSIFTPSIPVDAFNKAIWSNTQPNSFGTKNQFGDNSQSLTAPIVAASMSGLVSAAGAAKDSTHVSPWDIAQVAAHVAAGGLGGAVKGLLVGKALGALAGLTPDVQEYVKQTGLWTGVLTSLAHEIF